MGFIVRLHQPSEQHAILVGRVATAADALSLVRRWREDFPESWVEIVQPSLRPSAA